jgi:hypothetical protein
MRYSFPGPGEYFLEDRPRSPYPLESPAFASKSIRNNSIYSIRSVKRDYNNYVYLMYLSTSDGPPPGRYQINVNSITPSTSRGIIKWNTR